MILIDNKIEIIDGNVFHSLRKEDNIRNSNWYVEDSQKIWVNVLISSDYLIENIRNDIRR